jgi:hypothetical protein
MNYQEKYILLDNLFNLYLDSKYESTDNDLTKDWNVSDIVVKNIKLFKQLKTQTKAEVNQLKFDRIRKFLADLKSNIGSNQDKLRNLADSLLTKPQFSDLVPMFRNLKDISDKDRQSIMMDAKLLDLLSELESEFDSKEPNDE